MPLVAVIVPKFAQPEIRGFRGVHEFPFADPTRPAAVSLPVTDARLTQLRSFVFAFIVPTSAAT